MSEKEKVTAGNQPDKSFLWDIFWPDFNQVVPNHLELTDESQTPDGYTTGWSGGVAGWRVWPLSVKWLGTAWFKSEKEN